MRDFYCDLKFNSLRIDAEKKTIYSCWKAEGENIDLNWLKENPGQLFNTPTLQKERQQMLENKRVASCEMTCFSKEDKNLWSPRLQYKNNPRLQYKDNLNKYKDVVATPTFLDIIISGECNMGCSYCCKEFSSTWRNDIYKNGDYNKFTKTYDRFKLSNVDLALRKVSQNERTQLDSYRLIEQEIEKIIPNLKVLNISGGEPFLNDRLFKILETAKNIPEIQLLSGLGIKQERFIRCVEQIKDYRNIKLRISAESTEANYEFNRNGNTWKNFLNNLKILDDYKVEYFFNTTYSNLTVLDYVNFYTQFDSIVKNFNVVYEPDFMKPHVLDEETKNTLINDFQKSKFSNSYSTVNLINLMQQPVTEDDRRNLEYFVKQFSMRRKTNTDFMPVSLQKWLNLC
tara:strand:+ start:54 stop:1250 length:1197 start_codon:yes stop_codon:yes gene_type:complete